MQGIIKKKNPPSSHFKFKCGSFYSAQGLNYKVTLSKYFIFAFFKSLELNNKVKIMDSRLFQFKRESYMVFSI